LLYHGTLQNFCFLLSPVFDGFIFDMEHMEVTGRVVLDGTRQWQPGVFRHLPWSALGCIVGALLGIVASIAILRASDGVPITSWRYAPTVYLSITYTITNILLGVALGNGVTISWWRKALGEKTELGDLRELQTNE
jgi:hypothetical protein